MAAAEDRSRINMKQEREVQSVIGLKRSAAARMSLPPQLPKWAIPDPVCSALYRAGALPEVPSS
jgi:hypothetical protein